MSDLRSRDDIALLVTAFCRAAFRDPLIGPIFTEVAHLDLDHHLPIMCDFWQTVLFTAGLYHRSAGSMLRRLEGRSGSEFETITLREGLA